MHFASQRRTAVGRGAVAAVIIVVLILAAAGAVYFFSGTSNSSSSSTGSTSTASSGGTLTTSTSSAGTIKTLTIDDETWPNGNLNQLNAIGAIPYPNWLTYTVYQLLVTEQANTFHANGTLKLLPML